MAPNPIQNNFIPAALDCAQGIINIVPSDSQDLAMPVREIRVNAGTTLRVTYQDGNVANYDVAAGERIPGWITKVHLTGTNATGLVGYL